MPRLASSASSSPPPIPIPIPVGTSGADRHVSVDQDADGFFPGGDLLVRRDAAMRFVGCLQLAPQFFVDLLVNVAGRRGRGRPLSGGTVRLASGSLLFIAACSAGGARCLLAVSAAMPPATRAAIAFLFAPSFALVRLRGAERQIGSRLCRLIIFEDRAAFVSGTKSRRFRLEPQSENIHIGFLRPKHLVQLRTGAW